MVVTERRGFVNEVIRVKVLHLISPSQGSLEAVGEGFRNPMGLCRDQEESLSVHAKL